MTGVLVKRRLALMVVGALMGALLTAAPGAAHPEGEAHHAPLPANPSAAMAAFALDDHGPAPLPAASATPCVGGFAGIYPCDNVDLEAFLPLADIGGTSPASAANDIWGWTDPVTGREYAIIGLVFGTSFVDITDPALPVYLGELPTHGPFGAPWRDIKVRDDHAFIVSEALGHGMQVFDLTQLRGLSGPPVTFTETAHYNGVGSSHNIVINEDTGFAYIVGAGGSGPSACSGGLHMVDIASPASPVFAGCFSADGYTHDAQCVVYSGPDVTHQGREICLASNEDTLTIVDVTDKSNPVQLSRTGYAGADYTHQGWLTDDQEYFLLDDELDETTLGHNTRTRVFDVRDLDAPRLVGFHDGTTAAIDHNLYVKGNRVYQANYRSGLRILDISGVSTASLTEVGFFDIYPADDAAQFNGAWSNYPYFDSGVVVVSGIEQGLFVLRPTGAAVEKPSIRPTGKVVLEGDTGAQTVQIPVLLSAPAPAVVTVDWSTVDIPSNPRVAASGSDYVAASGTVTFAPGETVAHAEIEVLGDLVDEPPLYFGEWLVVAFGNPSANAVLDTSFFGLGIVIIIDDD